MFTPLRNKNTQPSSPTPYLLLRDESGLNTQRFNTQSYTMVANILFDIHLENIIIEPPSNYVGLDIGSCEGIDADRIVRKYPKGKIIKVDPFSQREDTIKIDGEEFVRTTPDDYDFIIVKYAIHYFKNTATFIKSCAKILKPGGRLYVFTSSPDSKFPWSPRFQEDFENTCVSIATPFNRNINGSWAINQIRKNTQLCKTEFADFIRLRGISNLYRYSEEEIGEELYRIESSGDELYRIELVIEQFIFHKKLI